MLVELFPAESNQKLLQVLRSQVTSMHSQPSPVELGRFSGYNAVGWVLQAELYFDFYAISNAHKLHYVSSYFDGDALEWFHWMSRNNQLVDWKYFKEQVVLRFHNSAITAPMGILVDPFQAHFDYARSVSMVPPVTQVFSFADLNIIPTNCKFESTSKVGESNAEQMFDEMPLTEDSPFSSDNEVIMSLEGFSATTEAHLLDECSQQSNHKVFVDEKFDVTTFSSEGHSDQEDEVSEVCDIQAQFEGSMSVVQKTLVVNNQEFVPKDFALILGNILINSLVSTTGPISKCASDRISYCSCLFTNFNSSAQSYVTGRHNKFELSGEKLPLGRVLDTCCCHKRTCSYLHFELEPILDILPFGSVVDAWVDTGQLSYSLSYVAETPHRFYNKLGRYPCVWNRSPQQLFDNLSQTCDCSKVFAENPQGDAIGMRCQFDLVRPTTGNSIIASHFIPSMFEGVPLMLDSSLQWCLSFNAFHAIPTMKFGENQVAAIADESLVFTLEFEEAFNLTFSIFRAYDRSTLAYHCIPKSKAMALISYASDAHDNAFMELFVVAYARIYVKLDRNFASISHKTPIFFKMNPNGQISLLDTLDNHVCENIAIACCVTLWHHQSILTCLQVESHNTLAYLAKNVHHSMHRNGSSIYDIRIDLNLENLGDTTLYQLCSILDGLKFPDHLMVQVRGSHLVRIESAKRISKYDRLMKVVIVLKDLVTIRCNYLQVTRFRSFSLDLFIHSIVISVYVQHGWLNHKRGFISGHDIVAALARGLIVFDFTVHTCENDSSSLSMIESELSLFSTKAKLVLPFMLALDLAGHSLEFGTQFNEESCAFMPPTISGKSSLFPTSGCDFLLIIIAPTNLGFFNSEKSPSTCWIKCLRFQSTNPECSFYTIQYDFVDPDAIVEYEFWANSDVECCRKCENQQTFVKHFKGAAQALEQNHLIPYSIIWYFSEAFPLHTQSKSASVIACQDTFWWGMCEFPILLELIFVGEGYTQYCEISGALGYGLNHKFYWKGPKNDRTNSTGIAADKIYCDCNSLEMGNACLVIQDVNVVVLHNLAALEANWFNWLVDQMNSGVALAIGVSGQDFIWDANMDRDSHDNNMIVVLLYSNLEGKVLFEGQSNVMNLATMQDPIDILSNYIWDPG